MSRRYASSLVSFVLTVVSGAIIFATPAQAAATGWPQDTTAVQNSYVQSAPDGSVVVANCTTASTAIKRFSTAGTTIATVPQRTDGVYTKSCHARGAIGKDGTVFGVAEDGYANFAAVAYRGTTKLWEQNFPRYCPSLQRTIQRAINHVLVGADGFVYVVTLSSQCFNGYYISKLNASTGQVVFDIQLSSTATTFVAATKNGLVAQNTQRVVRYLRYDGTDFSPSITLAGWVQTTDMNARVFVTGASTDTCSTSTLKMYTPGVTNPFNFSVPQCWQAGQVAATSQNGLAVMYTDQNGKLRLTSYTPKTGGGFLAQSTPALPDADSYRSFQIESIYGPRQLPIWLQTDVNGNILVVREYQWRRGDNTLSGWQFTLYLPNANVASEYDTNAFDFQQTARFARSINWAMAKDRLYVSVGYCTTTDPYQCGAQSVTLYAARMARLNMDYPRGAVLGVVPSTVTCKPVTFVGVRGSGEDPFLHEGLGEPVQHVKDRLVAAGLTNMEVVSVAYPATPTDYFSGTYPQDYHDSVTAGIDTLNGLLLQVNRDCPQTQILVVSYSQGSHATDGVRYLPVAIQNQIRAMVLFGDPLFNPALGSVNKGTFGSSLYGVWVTPLWPHALPARQFATSMTNKVASYCLAGDPVCNYSEINIAACFDDKQSCPHIKYRTMWTEQAATWMKGKVA